MSLQICTLLGQIKFSPIESDILSFYRMDAYPQVNATNFLFRGNMPVINGSFAYSEIVMTMKTQAEKHKYKFPNNFTLIDVRYYTYTLVFIKSSTFITELFSTVI